MANSLLISQFSTYDLPNLSKHRDLCAAPLYSLHRSYFTSSRSYTKLNATTSMPNPLYTKILYIHQNQAFSAAGSHDICPQSSRALSMQPQLRQNMSKKLNLQEHLEPAAHSDQPRKPQTSGVSCQAGTQAFSVVKKHTTANAEYKATPSYLGVGRALGWVGRSHGNAQVALLGGDVPNHAEVALLTPALAPAVLDQPVGCACLVLQVAPSQTQV